MCSYTSPSFPISFQSMPGQRLTTVLIPRAFKLHIPSAVGWALRKRSFETLKKFGTPLIWIYSTSLSSGSSLVRARTCLTHAHLFALGFDFLQDTTLRIPTHSGHRFRSKSATHSGASRPPVPIHSGRPFRSNPATSEWVIEAALDNRTLKPLPF